MSEHHHVVRVDFEHRKYLSEEVSSKLLAHAEKLIPDCAGIILQDYAKGVFSEELIKKIIVIAKKNNKKIIVDPHRATPLCYYQGVDLMTPNADEAIALTQIPADDFRKISETYEEVGQALMKAIGSEQMVVTRGKEGMSYFENNKSGHVPTFAREVFDVTGAGDTVISVLGLAWFSGLSLRESCILANHAAGVVVAKIGCATCSLDELRESFKAYPDIT